MSLPTSEVFGDLGGLSLRNLPISAKTSEVSEDLGGREEDRK